MACKQGRVGSQRFGATMPCSPSYLCRRHDELAAVSSFKALQCGVDRFVLVGAQLLLIMQPRGLGGVGQLVGVDLWLLFK